MYMIQILITSIQDIHRKGCNIFGLKKVETKYVAAFFRILCIYISLFDLICLNCLLGFIVFCVRTVSPKERIVRLFSMM